jgi:hypothetical protein
VQFLLVSIVEPVKILSYQFLLACLVSQSLPERNLWLGWLFVVEFLLFSIDMTPPSFGVGVTAWNGLHFTY